MGAVRLVDTDLASPQLTAAIDEAILMARVDGRVGDTVHLYRREPASVSIGYFQTAAEVVDLEACRRDGVPLVRRISGGGAIYTDQRQLVYALAFRPAEPLSALGGFSLACGALVRALGRLGVEDAHAEGVNDVMAGGAKVSGSAQAIRRGVHLVHGTVLVDADLEAMFTYLRALPGKLRARALPIPRARVTTLAELLGSPPPMDEVKGAVAEELAAAVGGRLAEGPLDDTEAREATRLVHERYTQDEWNLRR